jgi:hypothetical protein
MHSLPLSTLSLRALTAQRAAYPALGAAAARLPLQLPPALAALHGLPPPRGPCPSELPPPARAASRLLRELPPWVGPGRWALPASLPPRRALRLATSLALRLPPHLRRGPHLPQLLEEVLRHLGRSLQEHAKTEAKTWPTLRALAPAVAECIAALVGPSGGGSGSEGSALASPEFSLAERQALASALVARFLRLLAAFSDAAPGGAGGAGGGTGPSPRLALALSLCRALPPPAAAECAPALQALAKRLGEEAALPAT